MGKSLKQLIDDKQAIADLAATQAGNKVQPRVIASTSPAIVSSVAKVVKSLPFISAKDYQKGVEYYNDVKKLLVQYVGQEPIDRLKVELKFIENFPNVALREYGLDAPRILLQRDPHSNKKLIQKLAGGVATASNFVATQFDQPKLGRFLQKNINKVTDIPLKPLYPDDWLENPDSDTPQFNKYPGLYNHTISNSKGIFGNFLNANRTLGQLKENALPSALSFGVGAAVSAVQGVVDKFGGNTAKVAPNAKVGYNNNYENKDRWTPKFPSQFYYTNNEHEGSIDVKLMIKGYQQLRDDGFPTNEQFGTKMYLQGDLDVVEKLGKPDKTWPKLTDLYQKHFDDFLAPYAKSYFNQRPKELPKNQRGNVTTVYVPQVDGNGNIVDVKLGVSSVHLPTKYVPRGYISNLSKHLILGGDKDTDKVIGIYSEDSKRRWDDKKQAYGSSPVPEDHLDTVYQNYAHQSLHTDYFTKQVYNNVGGAEVINDSKTTSAKGKLNTENGSYWASYDSIGTFNYTNYWVKPVRWNTSAAPYSTAYIDGDKTKGNEILDRDYYFAANSVQSQVSASSDINPYLSQKRSILNNSITNGVDPYDRIKFSIGGIYLLGTLTGISDNTTPTWTDVKAVGSGFKFYLYDAWEREISFKFQMYAESETELGLIWDKAEKIKKFTLPTNNGINGVFGKLIKLDIGNLINEDYGFLTQANLSVVDDSPWEITTGLQKPFIYEMDITYKVIANSTAPTHYTGQGAGSAFKITTTKNGQKAAPVPTQTQTGTKNYPLDLVTPVEGDIYDEYGGLKDNPIATSIENRSTGINGYDEEDNRPIGSGLSPN